LAPSPLSRYPSLFAGTSHRDRSRSADRGWTWKFDPQVFNWPQFDPGALRRSSIPITLIRAEHGSTSAATSEAIKVRLGGQARELCMLGAHHHHGMFDQPVALIAGLQSLFLRSDLRRFSRDSR